MSIRGIVLEIIHGNTYFTRFSIKIDGCNDTLLLSAKNDVFIGEVGETFDFDINCKVDEKFRDGERFINQKLFVSNMIKA